jgi:deoxyribonucleoside regulator
MIPVWGEREDDRLEADLLRMVAQLYYVDNLGQAEIAELAGVSRPKVSRLLTQARQQGIVRISVEEFDPRNRQLEEQLTAALGLHHVLVIRTLGRTETENVRNSVGHFAAQTVVDWIRPNMVVGVAGGRTLASLVQHLQPRTSTRGVTFVQLMGNFGAQVSYCDAMELSRIFADKLQGAYYTLNAPAVAADVAACQAFLMHQDVKAIWALFDRMQIAFVGIGSLQDSNFIERGVVQPVEVSRLIAHGAIGELCGRFFDRAGAPCDPSYQERVVGIRLEELRHKPDVVAVTVGERRSAAIYAALKAGLARSLIIDEKGAEAVLNQCMVEGAR